jgi:hypothetical protein
MNGKRASPFEHNWRQQSSYVYAVRSVYFCNCSLLGRFFRVSSVYQVESSSLENVAEVSLKRHAHFKAFFSCRLRLMCVQGLFLCRAWASVSVWRNVACTFVGETSWSEIRKHVIQNKTAAIVPFAFFLVYFFIFNFFLFFFVTVSLSCVICFNVFALISFNFFFFNFLTYLRGFFFRSIFLISK